MLVALSGGLALPASNKHKHKSLSPKDKDGGRGLWTTDATKASLKNSEAGSGGVECHIRSRGLVC